MVLSYNVVAITRNRKSGTNDKKDILDFASMLLRSIKCVDRPSFHAAVVAGSENVLSVFEGYDEGVCVRIAYLERRTI